MEKHEHGHGQEFVNALVKQYGTATMRDAEELELLLRKIDLVVTAHVYAGNLGDNFLCKINRDLKKALEDVASYGVDEA